MSCCSADGYRTIFGASAAERDARRYRRKGLARSARWLCRTLLADGVAGRSLLEVGGGIGDLQIELLEAGAARAANVEIIDSYEEAARALIAEHGLEHRVERRVGDFARDAGQAPSADIVVMHRVLCCYPDAESLMAAACARSGERLAITIPRRSWWVRLSFAAMNTWLRLRRVAFRGYVHPRAPLLEVAAAAGLRPAHERRGALWESIVLRR